MNEAFSQGKLAFLNGVPLSKNPYMNSSENLALQWEAGWNEAAKSRKSFVKKYTDDIKKESINSHSPLQPHKYPLLIKLFSLVLVLAVLYSLFLIPKYITASITMKDAKDAFNSRDYPKAIELYAAVLSIIPSSKEGKIGIAEAIFSNENEDDDEKGLTYLKGITLDQEDWSRITKVMPVTYRVLFNNDVKY